MRVLITLVSIPLLALIALPVFAATTDQLALEMCAWHPTAGLCTPVVPEPNDPIVIPPDPTPEPNDPTTPPPVSGPIDARFAELLESPNLHAQLAMNNSADVCRYSPPCNNKGIVNKHVSYDPDENAFAVYMETAGISSKWQIRKQFTELDKDNAQKVSLQWEFKYSDAFLSTGRLKTFKAFQITNSSQNLMFEVQNLFGITDNTAVNVPTIRYYRNTDYTEATDTVPVSSRGPQISAVTGGLIDNWQPGGDTGVAQRYPVKIRKYRDTDHLNPEVHSPYIIRADLWTRITIQFDFSGGELRFRVWMSDEETPPTLIIASVKEPGKGFLLSSDTSKRTIRIQNWWLELNSSQDGTIPTPGNVWVKNFIVYKDADIPLE